MKLYGISCGILAMSAAGLLVALVLGWKSPAAFGTEKNVGLLAVAACVGVGIGVAGVFTAKRKP